MSGTVIVTGANGGIGKNYARMMLGLGYHVVLACRSQNSGQAALDELQRDHPGASAELMLVDLGDLASIKQFAEAFMARHDRLDVLAHNAGVYFFDGELRTSSDDIELNLAVHVVGPHALTSRLFPVLSSTAGARIVSMSSTEHRGASVDVGELEQGFDGNMRAYARSKWAALALTWELQRRLEQHQHGVVALAAHPGVSITGIQHKGNPTVLHRIVIGIIGTFFAGRPEDAARPLVMASVEGRGGQFFGPTGFKEMSGAPGLVTEDPTTRDEAVGASIWAMAERLSGVTMSL